MHELPENDQLDVYIVQKDTPFLEYQHPFPQMEGPNRHPSITRIIHEIGHECEKVK